VLQYANLELIEGLGNIKGFFNGVFPLLESMKHEIIELGMFVRFSCIVLGGELDRNEMYSQKSGVTACNVILIVLNWFRILIAICNNISLHPKFTPMMAKSNLMYCT